MKIPTACVRACAHLPLVLVILALCSGIATAQSSTHDVTGTVTSSDGTPIAGASVVLTSGGSSRGAVSDAHGGFVIRAVPSGTYSLHASARGYESITQLTVTIDRPNSRLAVALAAATTGSLMVIGRVKAAAGETVSTASAPSRTLNAQSAAAEGDTSVVPMIWNQLSVTPAIPLGGGSNATVAFAVRGPDPRETLVDIDGHQVNNGNTGDFDLSLVDPAALQAVQLIYGIAPSSLIGPNTIGGGLNILTLEPTATPHSLIRLYGGSWGTFGETLQTTGTSDRFGYAVSLHNVDSAGSVNQTILAPPPGVAPPANNQTLQSVGSDLRGDSILTKLRYQLGNADDYGYIQIDFRNQSSTKDESALLTNYTPPGFSGGGGDASPFDQAASGGYQSFAGTVLGAHQANYGLDAQVSLGDERINGAPATLLQFSHLTTLASQSVSGPGAQTQQYLYNQRDLLGDDWLEIDHHFTSGMLSFKYDLGTETLGTNYVQGQVVAGAVPVGAPQVPPVQELTIGQTERSAVLRYNGDPTSNIHYSVAAYESNYSTFGTSFDPRAGFVWTPTSNTAVRASVGTTFQAPQLSELVVPPPSERVPIGGVVFIGNPNLLPDRATDYDLGMDQIFGTARRPLRFTVDLYQSNLRSPAAQLNVAPVPNCQTRRNPTLCPISMPVNAGNGTYRGLAASLDQQLAGDLHVRAGWSVDSSFLTVIPPDIQDGTLAAGEQSLGQPLHKAFLSLEESPARGWAYGAALDYEGWYNELNRSPYATLDAHLAYRHNGFEYGLYGTNLTNTYADPFTLIGGGMVYGAVPGQPVIPTDAYVLPGASVKFVVTHAI